MPLQVAQAVEHQTVAIKDSGSNPAETLAFLLFFFPLKITQNQICLG